MPLRKFAFLGFHTVTPFLCRSIQQHPDAEVVAIADADDADTQDLLQVAPSMRLVDWEDLLEDADVDIVIAAPTSDWPLRQEQLQRLSQSNKSLVVQLPACETLAAVQLALNYEDFPDESIRPFVLEQRWHHWPTLASWIDDSAKSEIGPVKQVVLQRPPTREFAAHPLPHLANDIALLQRLVGTFTQVSALTSDKEAADWRGTTVSFLGETKVVAQWSCSESNQDSLLVLGEQGQALFRFDEVDDATVIEVGGVETPLESPSLEAFSNAFVGDTLEVENRQDWLTWPEACRALEIADVVERSRRRGRTLEVHQDERSEESSFKGVMAAGSCLILMFALGLLFVFSLIEGIRLPFARNEYERQRQEAKDAGRPVPQVRRAPLVWRLWPFYPFAIFLLLQLFRLIVPPREKSEVARE